MLTDRLIRMPFLWCCVCLATCSCVSRKADLAAPAARTEIVAKVYLFVNNDCPIANQYSPEIRRLHQLYTPRGIAFWLVHCDSEETEASVREHDRHYDLSLPVIMDLNQSLARRSQVEVVPSAAVFLADGELAYHGRIDDRFAEVGRERPQASRHDLAEALDAILDHHPVPTPATKAVGCYIFNVPR